MGFMISVLGSVIFWIGFFVVSFFIGTMLLKRMAPRLFKFITTGKDMVWDISDMDDKIIRGFLIFFILISIYIFWPIILGVLILYFMIKFFIWGSFKKAVIAIDSKMPTISFDKKEED